MILVSVSGIMVWRLLFDSVNSVALVNYLLKLTSWLVICCSLLCVLFVLGELFLVCVPVLHW